MKTKIMEVNMYNVAIDLFEKQMSEWGYSKNKQNLFMRFYESEIRECTNEMVQDHINDGASISLEEVPFPHSNWVLVYISGILKSASPYTPHAVDDEKVEKFDRKRDGYSVKNYLNGDIYEGRWKDNKREGKGLMKYTDDSEYDGEWKDDKPNG